MLNLIRMNLYRMTKTKSLWVVMLCMAAFCIFACSMVTIDLEDMQKNKEDNLSGNLTAVYTGEEEEAGGFGISVQVPAKEDGEIPTFLEFYNSDLASGIVLVFLCIGCVIYFNGEIKSGFLKNIAGQTKHKPNIFVSKIFANMIYIIGALFLYGIVQFISLWFMLKDKYNFRFGKEYMNETGVLLPTVFLLYLAFLGGISLVTTVLKSTAAGITLGMLSAFGVFGSFGAYADKLLHANLSKYMVISNVHGMLVGALKEDIFFAMGVGALFCLFYYLLGAVYFTKKDVV
ncbi:MAG: hypothetical protein K2P76_06680 [Lachnospiraceae bacterium]|nr:hypothetical protein [Lachnospiraceae bacterium]